MIGRSKLTQGCRERLKGARPYRGELKVVREELA
jgi:hypothetical protein